MNTKVTISPNNVRDAVNAYCQAKGISKSDLARRISVSPAVLSNLENGKWESIAQEMLLRIYNVVRPTTSQWAEVGTINYNTVAAVCEEARRYGRMQAIIGGAGYGKTTALRAFERKQKNVYYLACQKSMKPRQFFLELLQTMGLHGTGLTLYEMIRRVADTLNVQDAPLLVIDEAGKLTQTLLLHLHDLRNATEHRAGLVLAGVDYFKGNLEKAVAREKEGMPEFFSRVAAWEVLEAPTAAECRAVCQANGLNNPEQIKTVCRARNYRTLASSIINELNNPTTDEKE